MRKYLPVLIITLTLFIIPFFWLKPGEMDLGGDNTRLYYYDPISYIKYLALYNVTHVGKGSVVPEYFYLPFVSMLGLLKFAMSPTTLIAIVNGLKFSFGFLFVCLIVNELILVSGKTIMKKIALMSSILAGLFYVASFSSVNMTYFWDRALITHNQIFINPLMFYLLLKFIFTRKSTYLWISILVSFLFSQNFSPVAAPPFLAFYPLALIYLFLISKNRIVVNTKIMLLGFVFFVGVHAFHLLGEFVSIFDTASAYNTRIFNPHEILSGGLAYFDAIRGSGKSAFTMLLPSGNRMLQVFSIMAPLVVLVGFLWNKPFRRVYMVTSIFFLITVFFVTANITNIGYEFYKLLFYIPGFSMFRIFYEKWAFVHIFFYALLFGFGNYLLILKLKPIYIRAYFMTTIFFILVPATPLLLGWPINKAIIWGSKDVPAIIRMDPRYEETLQYIRSLPPDGKFLILPLTDFFRQLIYGEGGGVYEGPSTLAFLTDKYSFVGYQDFGYQSYDPAPYAGDIMNYSKLGDYQKLVRIFNTLNIRYILHNTDPRVYEETYYPGGDYYLMRTSLPKTQTEYREFVKQFPVKKLYENGPYQIYELDEAEYNPTVFVPQGVYVSNKLSFEKDKSHWVFIDKETCSKQAARDICDKYIPTTAEIAISMTDATRYNVTVKNYVPGVSLFLVLQHEYNSSWQVKLSNATIASQTHIPVNGYANGWYIPGRDLPNSDSFRLEIVLDSQKYFWYGSIVSVISLVIVVVLIMRTFVSKIHET